MTVTNMTRRKYTTEEYEQVLHFRAQGLGSVRISKLTGIPADTIQGWFSHGKKPRSIWTEEERKVFSRKQSAAKRGPLNPMWKGDDATIKSARGRAQRLYGSECPPDHEIHHIDGNPWNNERSNIQFVKRKKHMEIDGRIIDLKQMSSKAGKTRVKSVERDKRGRFI